MILTAGDSFTYGEELNDRINSAWPYLIARRLGTDCLNLGESGASNDTMVRLVVEHTSQQRFDLVVVAWTHPSRFEVWNEFIQGPATVMHNSEGPLPWTEDYYRYSYNEHYSYQRWFHQVLLLQQYLTSIKQPFLFVTVAGLYEQHLEHQTITQHIKQDRYPGWPNKGLLEWTVDAPKGPGGHPLELGHRIIADKIYEYIRN